MSKGKCYDENFKKETVKYILENGKPIAQAAREMDVNVNTLRAWVNKYGQEPELKAAQTFSTPDKELKDLQKHYVIYRRRMRS